MVTRDEYQKLLARPMVGRSRDERVRAANIAAGFGSSTAQRFMHEGAAKKVGGGGGGSKSPYKIDKGKTASTADVPVPTPRPAVGPGDFPPDLAVSPPRDGMMWEGRTGGGVPQNAAGGGVPMNPALSMASVLRSVPPELAGGTGFPSDLAVSPPHERWPGATGMPRVRVPAVGNGGPGRVPSALDTGLDDYSKQLTVPALLRRMSPFSLGGWG